MGKPKQELDGMMEKEYTSKKTHAILRGMLQEICGSFETKMPKLY